MTTGFMPQGAVESALGYDSRYLKRAVAQPIGVTYIWTPWNFSELAFRSGPVQPGSQTRSIPPPVVTPAMDCKRGIARVDTPGDGDSPTKRQRVGEHKAEHFGTRASNEGRFIPLKTDSSHLSPLDHGGGKVFSSVCRGSGGKSRRHAKLIAWYTTLSNSTPTRQLHQHTVVSGTLRALFRAHTLNEMLTRIAEPTVDTAAESECKDSLNDIVNGDVASVRYDPAFAATPKTLVSRKALPLKPSFAVPRTRTKVMSQKRKRDSSDRSQLGKRALIKVLLRKQGDEGFVPHQKHPENPGRKCNNTHAVRKDDTSKGLRFLHLSTETASAGSPSEALTQYDPPVSHAGPDQSELEQGIEITLSAKFRLDVETLVNELGSKGEALWTGERGPTAIAGYCSPPSIRKLAARDDDRLNDEIVNAIPIIAIPADNRTYLLPSYAFEHIRKGRFDRLSS
ncbi:hypothetical protein LTR12_018101 [Friedmanniomyces endolithicus]|nr:hypothetical protein LTR12_018101 [Friedmanniomyces endolithicus]